MQRRAQLSIITFLSILGIADSVYLSDHALTNTALSCGINGLSGCNVVAQSAYSHIFGVPLAVFGVVFYAVILVCSLILRARPSRTALRFLLAAATIGIALSLYFVGLQIFVIDAICIYCFASFLFAAGIFIATFMLRRSGRSEPLPAV